MKRKVCIITGSRSEYDLLKPLIEEIKNDIDLRMQLIVTGMHLSPEFGLTYKHIEKDGFFIDEKIEIILSSDTPVSISKSMGLAMISFAEAYERLKPDIIVVLGDRFEIFSAVATACVSRIPVTHIHGGELTKGVIDDSFRHSITKMSHIHFTATESYRKRIIQLGEDPNRVFYVGALGIDNIKRMKLLSKEELERELNFKFKKHNLLITYHPVTLEKSTSKQQFKNLLDVLDSLDKTHIIFTKTNADTEGRIINKMIDDYVSKNPYRSVSFISMGQLKYLSAMQFVDAVVGNSSSGIIEAPSFNIGTISIGDRQKGRERAKSVIDCDPRKENIRKAFKKLYSKEFQESLKSIINPYSKRNTAKRIKDVLKNHRITDILKKGFFDIEFEYRRGR